MSAWEVRYDYIESWLDEQDAVTVAHIFAAFEKLEEKGPNLGRPLVDTLRNCSVNNLKELRPASRGNTEIRILFAFDPARRAIMLLGGDKATGKRSNRKWSGWYKRAIPKAEMLWEEHLKMLEEQNEQP